MTGAGYRFVSVSPFSSLSPVLPFLCPLLGLEAPSTDRSHYLMTSAVISSHSGRTTFTFPYISAWLRPPWSRGHDVITVPLTPALPHCACVDLRPLVSGDHGAGVAEAEGEAKEEHGQEACRDEEGSSSHHTQEMSNYPPAETEEEPGSTDPK